MLARVPGQQNERALPARHYPDAKATDLRVSDIVGFVLGLKGL
jgi:hypothetical protein